MKVASELPPRPELSAAQRALLAQRLRGVGRGQGAVQQPIPRCPDGPVPLTFSQRRLWFAQQLAPSSPLYNISQGLRIRGALDERALEEALSRVVERHEPLRTRLIKQDGEPMQVVMEPVPVRLRVVDLTGEPADQIPGRRERVFQEEVRQPFNLEADILLRAVLVRINSSEHDLFLTVHHIAADGGSLGILVRELLAFYQAGPTGQAAPLAELPVRYRDLANWQRRFDSDDAEAKAIEWWKEQLAGAPEYLPVPADRPRPPEQVYAGKCLWKTFPKRLGDALKQLGAQEGATLFMTMLAAFQVLMHRVCRQSDLLLGSPTAGRLRAETEGLIGLFVNLLILRSRLSGTPTFRQFLRMTRETTLEACAHQELPFERLVEQLRPERTSSSSPVIQVVFALLVPVDRMPAVPGLTVTPIPEREAHTGTAKFDLTIQVEDNADGVRAVAEFRTDLFEESTIARLLDQYETLLEAIVQEPNQLVTNLPLLTPFERQRLIVEWNDTSASYPRDMTIVELFARQAAERPEAPAVVASGASTLTYRQLDQASNRLAHFLQKSGVESNVPVAVCLRRSPEMIVSLLAILKAGGAYLSLDPAYPEERLGLMLEDAQTPVVVTSEGGRSRLMRAAARRNVRLRIVCLDANGGAIQRESSEPRAGSGWAGQATDLAYVSYTSGSTGRPKGVAIPHRAVVRLLFNTNYIRLTSDDVLTHLSNCAFDASTFEIWGALLHGARLVVVAPETLLSATALEEELRQHNVTTMFVTTALFHQLARQHPGVFRDVRQVLFGGEPANAVCVREVLRAGPPERLLHMYGPTEATTFATWHEIREVAEDATTLSIGRAIANTELYVLDEQRQPVPIGVTGELYIGGDGLAAGYLNQPERTAEKFVPHPFRSEFGARLYRTGDLVHYQPDGNLQLVGRLDTQIKLRGFRIELAEVEAAVNQHPKVRESAVLLSDEAGDDRRLIAYVATRPEGPIAEELREFLRTKLPDYMVPSAFVFLEALPLNPHGKVDRRALPAPDPTRAGSKEAVPPRDDTECELTRIWEELLDLRPIGITDSFFDLGGHSLLVLQMIARVEKCFGKALPVSTVFQSPTIERLAQFLQEGKSERANASASVVEIQSTGSKPPLFLVHGAGGGMFWGYTNLARHLGTDQPVYGFKAAEPNERPAVTSLEDMAAAFVADLRAFQPRGPYYLGGYCFGGNVAYAMARRLVAAGEQVALLALMNSTPTDRGSESDRNRFQTFTRFSANLFYQIGSFLRRPWAEQRRSLVWRWRQLGRKAGRLWKGNGAPFDPDEFMDLSTCQPGQRKVWESHIRALVEHRTQPFAGRVTLLRSRGYHAGSALDLSYGWNEFVEETSVVVVPGTHEQILDEPFVATLATELRRCLEEAQRATADSVRRTESTAELNDEPMKTEMAAAPVSGSEWNATEAEYANKLCVHHLSEQQARRTPDAPAVLYRDVSLTYRELEERSELIAVELRRLGVGPDVPVGLCLQRSPAMVIGVLGILKAGGAYVPMDPAYPRERLQLMLENARVPVLITRPPWQTEFRLANLRCEILDIDTVGAAAGIRAEQDAKDTTSPVGSEHLAYVIHTSGSTGVPKGVAMPHRPLVNLITWQLRNSRLSPGARTLQFSSLSFDVSFQEMFSTWAAGGTLVLIDEELRRDPFALLRFLSEQKIERLFLPFVGLQQLAEAYRAQESPPASLREVITAGEQLQVTPGLVRLFSALPDCTLCNQYGPTESHVVTAFTLSGPPKSWPELPPIGRPIANTQIHVLDPEGQAVPVGAEGELHIAGDCLARGYLHRPDLTAERFRPNPFSPDPEARFYKTGDRARWRPDGNIEYLGRLDQQIKIRGYRIELGEVEAALARHPAVRECAVAVPESASGEKRMVGYVVMARSDQPAGIPDLRAFLGERLPDYMVPAAFVVLDALPLTPSGKVNRRALPAPDTSQVLPSAASVSPRTPIEETLVRIWSEVLGVAGVGVQHNFFELGGHSFLAVQMVSRIQNEFGLSLPVATIFQETTIERLAKAIEHPASASAPASSIVEIQPRGTKPPLYLVHGAGGGMFWGYANLARHLGDDQPIYAFNSRGLDGREEFGSIEAMAAQYVADLKKFQPNGPYRLGGYCFGGNVACEMASQLEAQGEKVALLAIFNAWPSNTSYTQTRLTPALFLKFLKNLKYWGAYVLQLKPRKQRELVVWKLRAMGRKWLRLVSRLRPGTPNIDVAEWVDLTAQPQDRHGLWTSHIQAYLRHSPKPYGGSLTLFRTRCHPLLCSFDDACGWREVVRGPVTVRVVPGAHESILDEPHVGALAQELKAAMPEATAPEAAARESAQPAPSSHERSRADRREERLLNVAEGSPQQPSLSEQRP